MPNSATLVQAFGAAFCAILCALSGMGGGGMSLMMRRNLMAAKSGYTARDYVQDGLIAMWDGIENAGWGVHDPNATVWKDLSGNGHDLTVYANATEWGRDSLVGLYRDYATSSSGRPMTSWGGNYDRRMIELVLKLNQYAQSLTRAVVIAGGGDSNSVTFSEGYLQGFYENGGCINTTVTERHYYSFAYNSDGKGVAKYLDGKLNTGSNIRRAFTLARVRTGCGYWSNEGNTYPLIGEIMGIRMYDRELSMEDVSKNYAIDKARFNLT